MNKIVMLYPSSPLTFLDIDSSLQNLPSHRIHPLLSRAISNNASPNRPFPLHTMQPGLSALTPFGSFTTQPTSQDLHHVDLANTLIAPTYTIPMPMMYPSTAPKRKTGAVVSLRKPRSRKDRPCDHCRRLKHTCSIVVRGEPCTNCVKGRRRCTFIEPPLPRHRKLDPKCDPHPVGQGDLYVSSNQTFSQDYTGETSAPCNSSLAFPNDTISEATTLAQPEDASIIGLGEVKTGNEQTAPANMSASEFGFYMGRMVFRGRNQL